MVAIVAAGLLGCSDDSPTSSNRAIVSPPIDRLYIFARTTTEDVTLHLFREDSQSTVVLFRQARDGQPRIVLDSIGPVPREQEPEKIRTMLASFDVWALNAPDAPGAACRTVNGERSCNITWNDYSIVMRVESGGEVRVQRYTGLELSSAVPAARGLGDFVLAWAHELEATGQAR